MDSELEISETFFPILNLIYYTVLFPKINGNKLNQYYLINDWNNAIKCYK